MAWEAREAAEHQPASALRVADFFNSVGEDGAPKRARASPTAAVLVDRMINAAADHDAAVLSARREAAAKAAAASRRRRWVDEHQHKGVHAPRPASAMPVSDLRSWGRGPAYRGLCVTPQLWERAAPLAF